MSEETFYDRVGGAPTFHKLVHEFYKGVAEDPPLRAMYPEEDLGPAEERLRLFLEQYWGGPKTYGETRGHPRLRIRHQPFQVTPKQAERWVTHMSNAVDTLALPPPPRGRPGTTQLPRAGSTVHDQRPRESGRPPLMARSSLTRLDTRTPCATRRSTRAGPYRWWLSRPKGPYRNPTHPLVQPSSARRGSARGDGRLRGR